MKKNGFPAAMAAGLILLDRLTKAWAMGPLRDAGGSFVLLKGVLSLTYVENRGAAFGMFQGSGLMLTVLTGIMILALLGYLVFFSPKLPAFPRWALWLMVSGAAGNFGDRLYFGYVVDFLQVLFIDFPVFNAADCCVTAGAALLAGWILCSKEDRHG